MNTLSKIDETIKTDSEPEVDFLQLIHEDNSAVAELFFQFTQAKNDEDKQNIFDQINRALSTHAQLVEELLYPLVVETAEEADKEDAEKLVAEAEAGNYVASMILNVLNSMQPDDEYFEGKMTILCELTKLQVKREEKEMFDKLRAADIDFEDIGDVATERKTELMDHAQRSKAKSKSKSKSKSTVKTKTGPKSSARKDASNTKAKSGKAVKKSSTSNKKATSKRAVKPAAKASKPTRTSIASKASNKKGKSTKQTSRSQSSTKSPSKKRSR